MDAARKHVGIVGAGIVGVSTAVWLQRMGCDVTLIDREGPAGGTSYGNAGVLAAASIVPVAAPGLLAKLPGMLADPDAPLFLRWTHLPAALPFFLKFLGNSRREKVAPIAQALATLLRDTADQHVALAEGTPAARHVTRRDYIFGYRDRAAFEKDGMSWDMRREAGYDFEELDAGAFAELDPDFGPRFGFGVRCPDHGQITDPGAYVKALAEYVIAQGGHILKADVRAVERDNRVITAEGSFQFDDVVIASGAWSGTLMQRLGLKVSMESERGYHIEYWAPSITPRAPIMVTESKFVLTPMEGRLRCAGVAEFGGLKAGPSEAPFRLLERQVKRLLPDLAYERTERWMGHRPSTADSLPLIGQLKDSRIWAGFGHQHIGLSGGPRTGRWLAQMITGQAPNEDLTAYSPHRFS